MATAADVITRIRLFPGMAAIHDGETGDLIEQLAADALADLNADAWGDKLVSGAAYLACHRYALLARESGAGGEITSERVGDVSVTYQAGAPVSGDIDQTVYGKLFKQLQKTLLLTPLTV